MAFDDLRSFLQALDDQGQLLKISEEVNAEPDLAAAANATGRIGDGAPALWFDNIRGFNDARVTMNTIGSWQNHAISLGLPPNTPVKKQIDEFIRRWDNFPVTPERRANPAWAENTVDGDDINLFDILPLFRLNDGDGGFYLDKACVVSRDPLDKDNFGKQNVGIYRMEVKGKRKLGLQPVPMHDIALHLHKAEERGEDLPIAITLGNDPIITLMGATPLKYDQSEYEMAGALRESPYPIATAPLNKEALHLAGHAYPGHTELLAHLTQTTDYAMVLYTEKLKVIHITTHISLRQFLDTLNQPRIETVIGVADRFLRRVGYPRPRIAVAGVNPHAGENGLFGDEEIRIVAPAVAAMRAKGVEVTGPCPPDTVFMQCHEGMYDMVVAMYHDQGHIPLKLLGFYDGVNITAGLPFIRTSADHGTAFDIAWTGKAKSESMATSIELAMQIAQE